MLATVAEYERELITERGRHADTPTGTRSAPSSLIGAAQRRGRDALRESEPFLDCVSRTLDSDRPGLLRDHRDRALGHKELLFVLDRRWKRLGRTLDPEDFTDAQVVAAIERITRGNFRLLERLFPPLRKGMLLCSMLDY